jgi:CubicO group peptidase (beta-lactamase class C family)
MKQQLFLLTCIACTLAQPTMSAAPAAPSSNAPAESSVTPRTPSLTKADADAWLDGFMPYALNSADVAGAVVVIVKDGVVLTQKGFGFADVAARRPVDPHTTLFRPGSTSKLFTWTAVMQQVELGKIDLDRDVNGYLDFKIPAYGGKPVTMRNIMTHTAGFEDAYEGLIVNADQVPPLDSVVKAWVPERIFAPGTTPAYSNYATTLAGYIVQRVSGEPFDEYIVHHIFQPLGMTHSTFSEPLTPSLAAEMSQGYALASQPPKSFEMFSVRPAGSATSNGDDMARFMIAHLDEDHGALLKPEMAREMHQSPLTLLPPLDRMDLGFYEQNLNGHNIIAHGGDTQWFHSYLWLLTDQNVGVFYSQNSAGRGFASLTIREALIQSFMDRYFPESITSASSFQARPSEAEAVAGTYLASRRSESGLRRALNFFSQLHVTANATGGLRADGLEFQGINGAPRDFVQIAPYVWRERNGSERLAAQVQNGQVVRLSVDSVSPFTVYERVSWYSSTAWLRPAVLASLLLLLGLILSFPAGWIARKYYGASKRFIGSEQSAYRWTGILSLTTIIILVLWLSIILTLRFQPLSPLVYLLQVFTIGVLPLLCLASARYFWTGYRARRSTFGLLFRGLFFAATLCTLWVAIIFNLTHIGLHY